MSSVTVQTNFILVPRGIVQLLSNRSTKGSLSVSFTKNYLKFVKSYRQMRMIVLQHLVKMKEMCWKMFISFKMCKINQTKHLILSHKYKVCVKNNGTHRECTSEILARLIGGMCSKWLIHTCESQRKLNLKYRKYLEFFLCELTH